ncbi:unnamed protein product [Urochloa decumbens]|uniref:Uncharacterized protein n=1 Tax=Urochloa decumbens TaxID=240449 RepID=A0ABC8WAB3_9POAL
MDMAPFKLDIDELIADFAKENSTALADFKRVWKEKRFSYIYEGRPKTNSCFFMQSLFLHCIGHLTSESSLPRRLAGLYCLYCLYECQPYKPLFKIYLSLEECRQLKDLIVTAKQKGVHLVPALVKRMLDKGMFLFGYMNLLSDNGEKQVEELTALQNKRVKFACDKLFANTQAESYMHMDLVCSSIFCSKLPYWSTYIASFSSTVSWQHSVNTTPWFAHPCEAGYDPSCFMYEYHLIKLDLCLLLLSLKEFYAVQLGWKYIGIITKGSLPVLSFFDRNTMQMRFYYIHNHLTICL